jgi:DNA-directed RNA polymerase sigma subunit (sigma70/sigma32)
MDVRHKERSGTLRAFVSHHPDGWYHSDWEGLVGDLLSRDLLYPGEEDEVGKELERERVRQMLEGLSIPGLGPKRREAVAERFGHVWELRHASADELAAVPGVTKRIADALHTALH